MTDLTPLEAARIAAGVYQLRENSMTDLARMHQDLGCEDSFHVGDGGAQRFTGTSGGLVAWKQVTGFGYLAAGKGARAGEVLIATRGTAIGVDWLTNLNVGMQFGPSGHLVHAGFNDVWKSFQTEVRAFLRNRNPSVIHCVGHSLGGALATLNADAFSHQHIADVRLYTFGSPRVGDAVFARQLSDRLAGGRIHRVYNQADPVPMIPLFPFTHVPLGAPPCALARGSRGLISVEAHSMAGSYIPGVGAASWASLELAGQQAGGPGAQAWLDQIADGAGGGLQQFGAQVLRMIGKALLWLIQRSRDVLVGALGMAVTSTMTVLDQLAWLLSRGAQACLALGRYVSAFIGAVCRFLGRAASATVEPTAWFIRYMLQLLFAAVRTVAVGALTRNR